MTTIGIDLEQFIRDPYATGIQRVLQQLALHWPDEIEADWVLPHDDGTFTLLPTDRAATLLTLPFVTSDAHALRVSVAESVAECRDDRELPRVRFGQLISLYDAWLLPEVSYLPSVLERFDVFSRSMPVTMIGYDALPMTDPANYRFVPGVGSNASEYFRFLASVDSVVCISDYSRGVILNRLRRDRAKRTTVAHPGGDHLHIRTAEAKRPNARPRFMRVGTMEARKQPLEILRGFQQATRQGADIELVFVGNPNASAQAINDEVNRAIADGYPVTWIQGATDAEVYDLIHTADAFLSIGTEGYGIPVLEAIRLGTPVLFDGIQPAADLMVGRGAQRISAASELAIAEAFGEFADPSRLRALSELLAGDAVPTWSEFARTTAKTAATASGA